MAMRDQLTKCEQLVRDYPWLVVAACFIGVVIGWYFF